VILKTTYTKAWVEKIRKQKDYKKADPSNIEKMLYALSLLENLVESRLEFIFKGGTALILLFEKPYRFSIDIDIITSKTKELLEEKLDNIIENSLFTHWELDEKRSYKSGVPKAHYKFFYKNANFSLGNSILLDVLFSKNPYIETVKTPIKTDFLDTEEPYSFVTTPSLNSILGDKLTAFAPNTTGIKYNSGKQIEIIKQLFDVSLLIDCCNNISIAKSTFIKIANEEVNFRKLSINYKDVIEDIFNTALIFAKRDKNKAEPEKSQFKELQTGTKNISNYLIIRNLKIEQAIASSAKTSYFTQLFLKDENVIFAPYSKQINLTELEIKNTDYNFINRFKKTNKEAFYYWFICLELKNCI